MAWNSVFLVGFIKEFATLLKRTVLHHVQKHETPDCSVILYKWESWSIKRASRLSCPLQNAHCTTEMTCAYTSIDIPTGNSFKISNCNSYRVFSINDWINAVARTFGFFCNPAILGRKWIIWFLRTQADGSAFLADTIYQTWGNHNTSSTYVEEELHSA